MRALFVLFFTGFAAISYAQDSCNPYEAACAVTLASRPQVGPIGPAGPVEAYPGQPVIEGSRPVMVWHLSELFIDAGDHAFGWLVLENLDTRDQIVTVVYTFDDHGNPANARKPEYRYFTVYAANPRRSFTLNDPTLENEFYSATVYFPGKGTAHATFRPYRDSPQGTSVIEPQAIPQTTK